MGKKTTRVVISALVIFGALSILFYVTAVSPEVQFYKHVNEVMAQPQQWYGKSLQLHGFVVDGSVFEKPDTLDYRFKVQNDGAQVLATYTGVVPDTFKGGAEVVLKGRLEPDGFHVDPNGVVAKCPSKYQATGVAGAQASR
jgi:cytochrome c-type biogenesis protein CcmE